jgi:hypothetical protein
MRAIEVLMRDQNSKYYRGPESRQLQASYRDLIDREIAEQAAVTATARQSRDPVADAARRVELESQMGKPDSSYWRGDGTHSAAEIQSEYRSILNAEAGE